MIQIEVTQDDIDAARTFLDMPETARYCNCPVALAASRALGREVGIIDIEGTGSPTEYTDLHLVRKNNSSRSVAPLPKEVVDRINLFDLDGRMDPFSFEIEVPA